MVKRLHDLNYHLMISIWPGLGPETAIYKEMAERGFLYAPVGWAGFRYYDAFNPEANDLYLRHLDRGLRSKGIDAWWIDSTEPDVINALTKESSEYELKKMGRHHLGSWHRHLNSYSLAMMDALHANLRRQGDDRRVYLLTRSAFAGQQRTAATTWSGDIGSSWEIYRKQIAAGLNFSMSGIPYWTFDIGGFVIASYGGTFSRGGKDPAYQELYTRMFQFGAFCPIFRSHGSDTPREMWEMGEFEPTLVKYDRLRYRLLPYIYSLAWQVTSQGYTMLRGLPMDFPTDRGTHEVADQFLFGPALMVSPVTEYQLHRPPEPSVLVPTASFRTPDGKPGLLARYYKDTAYKTLGPRAGGPDRRRLLVHRPARLRHGLDALDPLGGKLVPNEEAIGISICGEGDGGGQGGDCGAPQPSHHPSEGFGVAPGPAERSDSCLPRPLSTLDADTTPLAAGLSKRQSARAICLGGSAFSP